LIDEPGARPELRTVHQSNSEVLSMDLFNPSSSLHRQQNEPLKVLESYLPRQKDLNLIRYPSSGVICSASVPLSPPYLSNCESKEEIEIRHHQDPTTSALPSNSLSTKIEGSNATQFDVSHTPFSQLQETQLVLESESDSHQGSVISDSLSTTNQIVNTNSSSLPFRSFIPDTYAAAESSLLDGEESQLSSRLTLSQIHPTSVYTADDDIQDAKSKTVATVVPDTYQDDQMTLDIDISENEFADSDSNSNSDSSSELSDEITRHRNQNSNQISSPLSSLPALEDRSHLDETNILIPQTQTIFSIESNENPRLVFDTYQDHPVASLPREEEPCVVLDTYEEVPVASVPKDNDNTITPPPVAMVPNSLDTNPYELSSSEDDYDNYLQFSTRKKERDVKKIPTIPEDVVVNLVSDTLSPIPISGLEGTLVSGTIQKSSTLLETDDDPLSQIFEDEETRQELTPVPVLDHKLALGEQVQPVRPSTPVQQELEPYSEKDYNVESYSTQCEMDKQPEIGGYLYGAGIDSAVRRFTPQKASPSPQKSFAMTSPPVSSLATRVENKSSEKALKKVDMNSDSYETQDSFPSRFTWLSNVTTPIKRVEEIGATRETLTRPFTDLSTPPRRPSDHQEDTNTNDEIASWGESVCASHSPCLLSFLPPLLLLSSFSRLPSHPLLSSLIGCMISRK
jgi:hypothetical protein